MNTSTLSLDSYHHLNATRTELLRLLSRNDEAQNASHKALELVDYDNWRCHLERWLRPMAG